MGLRRLPVRARLVAGFALAMTVVLIGAGAFVFWRVQYALDRRLDQDLARQASDLRAAATRRSPQTALATIRAQARDTQLLGADGRVLASGSGLGGRLSLLSLGQVQTAASRDVRVEQGNLFSDRGNHLRILALPVRAARSGRAAIAVTAVRLDQRDEALRELLLQLSVANLAALALACLVGYRLAHGALDPVERYRTQAERIAQGATGVRLDVPAGPNDEISRLGATLNAMLAEQELAAERQQQFVDDASHELRTPISAMAAEVELALRRPRTADELQEALHRISTDTSRLVTLADQLLTLGALGSTTPAAGPVPIRPLLEDAARRARAQHSRGPARIVVVDAADELLAHADAGLMARALGNLVDNAVRHGAGTITLSATPPTHSTADACVIRVHDQGTALDAGFLAHAAERFRRSQASRAGPGTGLGLSLVDAIAAAHHGQMRICSNDAHHQQPTTNTALADEPCRHPANGTTISLLMPGGEL